jgi:hypothetical protein
MNWILKHCMYVIELVKLIDNHWPWSDHTKWRINYIFAINYYAENSIFSIPYFIFQSMSINTHINTLISETKTQKIDSWCYQNIFNTHLHLPPRYHSTMFTIHIPQEKLRRKRNINSHNDDEKYKREQQKKNFLPS